MPEVQFRTGLCTSKDGRFPLPQVRECVEERISEVKDGRNMEEQGTVLYPVWKELVKVVVESWEFGSKHTHTECADILGEHYGSIKYYTYMNKAQDELSDLGHRIRCIKGYGYYKLTPSEYPEAAYCDTRKSVKYLRKGVTNIHGAPTKHMDDNTKRKTENIAVFMGKSLKALSSTASDIRALAGITRPQKMLNKAAVKGKE